MTVKRPECAATIGLGLPQTRRIHEYRKSLTMNRDELVFDDVLRDFCIKYAFRPKFIEKTVSLADSVQFAQSVYDYSQIEAQISRFEQPNHEYRGWMQHFKAAKALQMKATSRARLRSLNFQGNEDVMASLPKKDTHAGFEYILTGLRRKGEYEGDIHGRVIKAEEEARKAGHFSYPMLIGRRTQASIPFDDEDNFTGTFKRKSRLVSMVSVSQIVSELRWAKPFTQYFVTKPWFAGGKSDVGISSLMNRNRHAFANWISLDFSGFDQTISDWLIWAAFDIIENAFSGDSRHDPVLFRAMANSFVNKCFVDGDGKLRYSNKGVPSGSMFTQVVDSIVNRLMIDTYLISKGMTTRDYEMVIMGDDNIIFSHQKIDSVDIAEYLVRNFGVTVNADKASQGTSKQDPEFLSRSWAFSGAYRPFSTLILKLMYPERFRDYHRGNMFPELVFYSYYLAYSKVMRSEFDIAQFFEDYPNLKNKLEMYGTQGLSGYIQYVYNYESQLLA